MSTRDDLLVARQDGCLRLTINRPEKRNALSLDLLRRIGATLAEHADDSGIQCAVLTAAGDRCFAAGGDLRELEAVRTAADARAMSRLGRTALDLVREFPAPVIAALNGHAYGGGAELAMACDLRVAVREAELGFLQAQLNVTPAWGGGIDLLASLGNGHALATILSAARIPAPRALELGLVQRVCREGESLEDCLAEFLAPLLARPAQVLRAGKAVAAAARRNLHAALGPVEEARFVATWTHEDHWTAAARALAPRKR